MVEEGLALVMPLGGGKHLRVEGPKGEKPGCGRAAQMRHRAAIAWAACCTGQTWRTAFAASHAAGTSRAAALGVAPGPCAAAALQAAGTLS